MMAADLPQSSLILLRGAPGCGKSDLGAAFENRFGWKFVELDDIKRRRGDVRVRDEGAFSEAGEAARRLLDAGRDVIAEEFFVEPDLIARFLAPTGIAIDSPRLFSCWLNCDVLAAIQRKHEQGMEEGAVREAHAIVARRSALPREIVLDTTADPTEVIVSRLAEELAKNGLRLPPP